jgi:hypothetical protein
MYGQFHNQQTLAKNSQNFFKAESSVNSKKMITGFISILVVFTLSANTFAGSKESKLPGGNGNAQGR